MTEPTAENPKIPPPPPLTRTLVRRILGFGVWVAVGLAPFLGAIRVPGLTNLLELYPYSSRLPVLAFSGFLMGVIALVIENAGAGRLTRKSLARWFRNALTTLAVSFLLLVLLYQFLVVKVEHQPRPETSPEMRAFVTGALTVPAHPPESDCKCRAGQEAASCIEEISFSEPNVRTCFGPIRVTLSNMILLLLYLALTGSFAASVGIFILRQRVDRGRSRTRRGAASVSP
jgi:hypothetical protein